MANNDPNGIDVSALSDKTKPAYDAIVGFFTGLSGAQSKRQGFARKLEAASA